MHYIDITSPDINNGLGCRVTLWISGCKHKCKGCHNPETWDFNFGKQFTQEIVNIVLKKLQPDYISGLTLSGGDPLSQDSEGLNELLELCKTIKEKLPNKTIWIYSGDVYENLIKTAIYKEILSYCDVLIDGPYIESLRDITLAFRGSKNQRIIDLHKSSSTAKLLNIE